MKKILIYNWIAFDEKENKGGGVSVYTRNLVRHLSARKDWEVYFLSSGRAYDLSRKGTFIESVENMFGDACKSFQIVNSPVLSSAHLSFPYPWMIYEDKELKKVVRQFLEKEKFDIVHFQNLEGLSLGMLALKREFPEMKFLYSLHNYYPFCPQVMLWKEDSGNCREKDCGTCCIACMPRDVHRKKVVFNQWLAYRRQREGRISPIWEKLQKVVEDGCGTYDRKLNGRITARKRVRLEKAFKRFREENVCHLNQYMDVVLAVSERTAEIGLAFGVRKEKMAVSYIGTEVASEQRGTGAYPYGTGAFRICYLGYMRKAKGFYFLMEALEKLPPETAAKIGLILAVRITDREIEERIECLRKRMAEIRIYDGYQHEDLPKILTDVQLGIVPNLWEDNLPQVAIEMKAYGIPVLTSDCGGAKAPTKSDEFCFPAGDVEDFQRKLSAFVAAPERLGAYWVDAPKLPTMEEHIADLMKYYLG